MKVNLGCDREGSERLKKRWGEGGKGERWMSINFPTWFPLQPQFHLLARRGSLPLLMVTEDFAVVGGPEAGGAPLPGDRPLGLPTFPNAASRGAPGGGLLLLLANGGMAPLPGGAGVPEF